MNTIAKGVYMHMKEKRGRVCVYMCGEDSMIWREDEMAGRTLQAPQAGRKGQEEREIQGNLAFLPCVQKSPPYRRRVI